jgi:hypothetical protein
MPFIKKDHNALPDTYGLTIYYLDGRKEDFELASHHLGEKIFEFCTKDDLHMWIPMTAVKRIEWDKRFSKIVAVKKGVDAISR